MSRRIPAVALLALALLSTAAAPAEARVPLESLLPIDLLGTQVGGPVAHEAAVRSGFELDPAGPYKLRVLTAGNAVVVSVVRGNPRRHIVETDYLARGVAAPERLQARFGKLGKISMRFREARHRPWLGKKRRCRGRGRFVVRRGVFVGNFGFRGEDGYLSVRAHRVKGSIATVAAKCQRRERRGEARSSSVFEDSFSGLIASDRNGVDATAFGALSFRHRLFYIAQREEDRGRMAILRGALVRGHGEFPLNDAATAGRFTPGAPFHGSGHYRAAADGTTSWSGNLSVDFPGAPRYPLTGPTYATFLEAGF